MIVKKQNFLNLEKNLKDINFNNDNLENSLKEQFSRLFQLDGFDEKPFLIFVKQEKQAMLQKNIIVHRDYTTNIELINKSFKIALDKNNKEIEDYTNKSEKRISELLKEFSDKKRIHSSNVFDLRINNETVKSEHYAVFEEELSQINKEVKERKSKFLIEQNRLDYDKNLKIEVLDKNLEERLSELNEEINNLKQPFEQLTTNLKSDFNLEQQAKDESYLTIKKTFTQSSIKFNDFIKNVKTEFNTTAAKDLQSHQNKLNDLNLEIEDLNEYYETAKEMIQAEYLEKVKALDIVFDVQRNDHNKNVQTIITNNNNEITNINATFRALRNNLNEQLKEKEKIKVVDSNRASTAVDKRNVNTVYRRETEKIQKQIIKLNEDNELRLLQQDIIFQNKIYNQDLKHLKHVNEWRYTKEVYEKERNMLLAIEQVKYKHELFTLEEKIELEKNIFKIRKDIHNNKLEKQLLPIESQLFFASLLQTRDINLLNLEFESFKVDNQLQNKLNKLNNDLEELLIYFEIKVLKEHHKFDSQIINIKHQLNTEKLILERDSDLEILNLNIKLQETLLNQKNTKQENLISGKINIANLELEKLEKIIDNKIKNERKITISEQQKRNFIINEIQNKNQKTINKNKSQRTIDIAKHEAEFNYELNKEITDFILNLYTRQHEIFITFTSMIKSPAHPSVIRELFNLIQDFNDLVLLNSKASLNTYLSYEKDAFNNVIEDYIQSKYQTKHQDIIDIFSENINNYQNNINTTKEKISNLEYDNKLMHEKIENNLLVINSLLLASKKNLSLNEHKQTQLLQDEINATNILVKNNLKLIKNLNKEIKRFDNIITNYEKQQLKSENKLFKNRDSEKKYYQKLFTKHENKYNLYENFLNNYHLKFNNYFNKLNQGTYLDDKNINTINNSVSKLIKKHYEDIIYNSFKLLNFWHMLYLTTKKNETKVIERFNKSADLSSKSNEKNYYKLQKISNKETKFNKTVFENEIIRIEQELKKIIEFTDRNVQVTHDQYRTFYVETENEVKKLKNISTQKLQVVNENLNSVIDTITNSQEKSISNITKDYNRNKTEQLTNIILTKNEIKDNLEKNNSRANIIISKYNKNRLSHLDNLKLRRDKFNKNVNDLNTDISISEEAYNIKVKRNLKRTKASANEFEIQFNLDKVYLRKENRKEIRINRKKLKNALKFKSKQIRRKKK